MSANNWGKVPTVSGEAEGRPGEARQVTGGGGGAGCASVWGGGLWAEPGSCRSLTGCSSAGGESSEGNRQA